MENQIPDQLSRTMIGNITAPLYLVNPDASLFQCRFHNQQVPFIRPPANGNYWRVLQENQRILNLSFYPFSPDQPL